MINIPTYKTKMRSPIDNDRLSLWRQMGRAVNQHDQPDERKEFKHVKKALSYA